VVEEKKATADTSFDVEYEKHLQNILGFKELAEKKKSKLLFVLVPGDNEKLKPFLQKEHIDFLDLRPIFEKISKETPLRWKINGHWNVAGNHLAGFAVSKYIIENNLVTVADKEKKLEDIHNQAEKEFGVEL